MPLPEDLDAVYSTHSTDRDRIQAYSPALDRLLTEHEQVEEAMGDLRGQVYQNIEELTWGLPEPMTDRIDDTVSLALTRHPTRDRTVIYTTLDRFVERFDEAFQEDSYTDFRDTLDERANESFETYFSIWDRKHEGWDEVVWTWSRIADIDDLLEERDELLVDKERLEDDIEQLYDRLQSRL